MGFWGKAAPPGPRWRLAGGRRRNLKEMEWKTSINIQVDEANLSTWQGRIANDSPLYREPSGEKGQVCLPVTSAENWKSTTKTNQVLQFLTALVDDPSLSTHSGLAWLDNTLRAIETCVRMLKSLQRNIGKSGLQTKTCHECPQQVWAETPSSAFKHPTKQDSVEIDTCHQLEFTCGCY